ncbi:hypothetical protein HDU76_013019, partial [Blyttiomyces sp. JEL0837]
GSGKWEMYNSYVDSTAFSLQGFYNQGLSYDDCNNRCYNNGNCFSAEYDVTNGNCELRTLTPSSGIFLTLPWWNNFPQPWQNTGNAAFVDQGLSGCQYNVILQISSMFEYGSPSIQLQGGGYLSSDHDLVINLGLQHAVSKGALFDTSIQLGVSTAQQITYNVRATSPRNGGDEITWLNQFFQAKINYLNTLGGTYAATVYRVNSYQHIVNTGNYDLYGSVEALDNGGNRITLSC